MANCQKSQTTLFQNPQTKVFTRESDQCQHVYVPCYFKNLWSHPDFKTK